MREAYKLPNNEEVSPKIIEMAAVTVANPAGEPSEMRYESPSLAGGVKLSPSVAQKLASESDGTQWEAKRKMSCLRVRTRSGQSSWIPRKFSTHCPVPSACPLSCRAKP